MFDWVIAGIWVAVALIFLHLYVTIRLLWWSGIMEAMVERAITKELQKLQDAEQQWCSRAMAEGGVVGRAGDCQLPDSFYGEGEVTSQTSSVEFDTSYLKAK